MPWPLSTELTPGGIAKVNGDFGEEEPEEGHRLAPTYSLSLTFATRSGAYLADVFVRITDSGGEVLVEVAGAGPKLLAGLPPGIYRISATQGETRVQRTLTVEGPGRLGLTLTFPDPQLLQSAP